MGGEGRGEGEWRGGRDEEGRGSGEGETRRRRDEEGEGPGGGEIRRGRDQYTEAVVRYMALETNRQTSQST